MLSNDGPNPESRQLRDEAAKAAALHAKDPVLAAFYGEIVRNEDADQAFLRRSFVTSEEWTYD